MGFFDQVLPTAVGNVLGTASAKVSEAASHAVAVFQANNPFTKVSATAPSLTAAAAAVQSGAATSVLQANAMTAQQIEKAAGLLDPAVSASSQRAATTTGVQGQDHFVMIEQIGDANAFVKFVIMPDISESRTIEYEAIAPPQSPGAFQKYKGTVPVQWSVNATLASRTTTEATENLRIINQLRGWSMPYFGDRILRQYPQKLGAPPPVLRFSGFRKNMVGPVNVVMTSLQWSFPQDVDYIPANELSSGNPAKVAQNTGKLIPFPTVMKVTIQLVETLTADQMNGFSLADYTAGQFGDAFTRLVGGDNTQTDPGKGPADGSAAPIEEAQTLLPNSLRGGNGYVDPSFVPNLAGQGRGGQGGPTAAQLATVAAKTPKVTAISELPTAIITYPNRLPISPTATEGNVEDLGLG